MRSPRSRSSSTLRRGSFAISRRYAASVPTSLCVIACRLATRRAYIERRNSKPKTEKEFSVLTFQFDVFRFRSTDQIGGRRLDERRREALLPIVETAGHLLLDVLHELVDLVLHLLDLAAHVEDDLDAREIHAQISGK